MRERLSLYLVDPDLGAPPDDTIHGWIYRLAVQRLRLGLSVRELARIMGTSAGHLSNVENGSKEPTRGFLSRYRSALLAILDETLAIGATLDEAEHGSARVGRLWLRAIRAELAGLPALAQGVSA